MDLAHEKYEALEHNILAANPAADAQRIRAAFEYANDHHGPQLRKSGEPYIIHPIAVAEIITELELDQDSIIAALLHDLCKIGCYKAGTRNVKDDATGKWEKVPTFYYEDKLPYGHGEKSVYIISGFMRLTREEAMAIRWHMGFSGPEDNKLVGQALQQYPLAFALATADMEASYFLEKG